MLALQLSGTGLLPQPRGNPAGGGGSPRLRLHFDKRQTALLPSTTKSSELPPPASRYKESRTQHHLGNQSVVEACQKILCFGERSSYSSPPVEKSPQASSAWVRNNAADGSSSSHRDPSFSYQVGSTSQRQVSDFKPGQKVSGGTPHSFKNRPNTDDNDDATAFDKSSQSRRRKKNNHSPHGGSGQQPHASNLGRFYTRSHRRNAENWCLETLLLTQLRKHVDAATLQPMHLDLLAELESTVGSSTAVISRIFPGLYSVFDLRVHLAQVLARGSETASGTCSLNSSCSQQRVSFQQCPGNDDSGFKLNQPPKNSVSAEMQQDRRRRAYAVIAASQRRTDGVSSLPGADRTSLALLKIVEYVHPVAPARG